MALTDLTALRTRLATAPVAVPCVLDATLLGNDVLADHVNACLAFRGNAFSLQQPLTVGPLDPGGFFSVSARAGLLQPTAVEVTLTFFTADDGMGNQAVEVLLQSQRFPASWTLGQANANLPGYADYSASQAGTLAPSFLGELPLASPALTYSSYDFAGAADVNGFPPDPDGDPADPVPHFTHTLPASAGDVSTLTAGVSFRATVPTSAACWREVSSLVSLPTPMAMSGLIGVMPETDERFVTLTHDFAEADGTYPALKLPGLDQVGVAIKTLSVQSGLDTGTTVPPGIGLVLGFAVGTSGHVDVMLDLSLGAGKGALHADVIPPVALTPDWLAAFGLHGLLDRLPASLDDLGGLALSAIEGSFTLSPPSLDSFSVSVTTHQSWELIEGTVAVEPTFTFGMAAGTADDYLQIQADWYLGGAEDHDGTLLELLARSDTGDVQVTMAVGETLDMGGLFADLMPGFLHVGHLDFTLIDLDVTGNYHDRSFSFVAEAGGAWGFDIFGAKVEITDVQVEAEYQPGVGFAGDATGVFELGGITVSVAVALGDTVSVDVTVPQLNVGDLLDDVLQAIDLPAEPELRSFAIDNLDVHIEPAAGTFEVTGACSAPVDLIDGLTFTVRQLHVLRAPPDPLPPEAAPGTPPNPPKLSASITLELALGGGDGVSLTAQYDRGHGGASWNFLADASATVIPLGHLIEAVATMVHLDLPLPIAGLGIAELRASLVLGASRSFAIACTLIDTSRKTAYGRMTFMAVPAAGKGWDHVLVVEAVLDINVANVPVAGAELARLGPASLQTATLQTASRAFGQEELGPLAGTLGGDAPLMPPGDVAAGTSLSAVVVLDQRRSFSVDLDAAAGTRGTPGADGPGTGGAPGTDGGTGGDTSRWFDVFRTFGALRLDRIGVRYADGALLLMFDAEMTIGVMQVALTGLGVGSRLDHFQPEFALDGLAVQYQSGPITLGGGLVRSSTPAGTAYSGTLQLTTQAVSLALLGRYTTAGQPSLFVFGLLDEPTLGGPPFFFVEGLAVGIGYNNRVNLPGLDGVPGFSLVQAAFPSQNPFQTPGDLGTVIAAMGTDFSDEPGEFWLAAGVRFSSFQLVHSFALLVVEFGRMLELSLLGLAQASIPPEAPTPLAFAELAIEATCDPATGVLQVFGELTPSSYVLAPACQLRGGFAFCTWFRDVVAAGEPVHAGDFVYTLGGYHPLFQPPAHYPGVPRLSLSWQVDGNLSVVGQTYFAVTPACIMAGGALSATFSCGGIRAWFDCHADFLLSWKPFHYEADVGCSIGVSVTLDLLLTTVTISLSVGVDLHLSGPDFGGTATIDLRIASFSISFGAGSDDPGYVPWSVVRSSFLPSATGAPQTVITSPATPGVFKAVATTGLFRDLSATAGAGDPRWVFVGERLSIALGTPVPCKQGTFNGEAVMNDEGGTAWSVDAGVGPAGVPAGSFASGMTATLEIQEAQGAWKPYTAVTVTPLRRALPGSLWLPTGATRPSTPNGPPLLADALCGVTLSQPATPPDSTCEVDVAAMNYEFASDPIAVGWAAPAVPAGDPFRAMVQPDGGLTFQEGGAPVTCRHHVLGVIASDAATAARTTVIAAMAALNMHVDPTVDVAAFGSTTVLDDWPRIRLLGEEA